MRDPDARAGLSRDDELCGPHELVGQDGRDRMRRSPIASTAPGPSPRRPGRRRAEDRLALGERAANACPVGPAARTSRRSRDSTAAASIGDPIGGRRIVDRARRPRSQGQSAELSYVLLRDDRRRGDLVHPVRPRSREPGGAAPAWDPDEKVEGAAASDTRITSARAAQFGRRRRPAGGDGHRRAGQRPTQVAAVSRHHRRVHR